eukprot:gene10699-biopygen9356
MGWTSRTNSTRPGEMTQDKVNEQGLGKSSALGRLSANSTRPGEKVTQDKKNGQGLDKSPTAGSVDSTRTGQVELISLELGELWTSHPDPSLRVSFGISPRHGARSSTEHDSLRGKVNKRQPNSHIRVGKGVALISPPGSVGTSSLGTLSRKNHSKLVTLATSIFF